MYAFCEVVISRAHYDNYYIYTITKLVPALKNVFINSACSVSVSMCQAENVYYITYSLSIDKTRTLVKSQAFRALLKECSVVRRICVTGLTTGEFQERYQQAYVLGDRFFLYPSPFFSKFPFFCFYLFQYEH